MCKQTRTKYHTICDIELGNNPTKRIKLKSNLISNNCMSGSSSNITVNLKLNSRQYKAKDKQILTFTLSNNSNESVSLLKWHTPLEGILNDMFWVKREEEATVYLGKMVKRAAPKADDYLTLEPKESISTDFDVSEVYDISKSGNYTVEFDSRLLDLGTEEPMALSKRLAETGESTIQRLTSKVEFKLLEDRTPKQSKGIALAWSEQLSAAAEVTDFRSCTTAQQNQLNDALREAERIAKDTQNYLRDINPAARYVQWFGNFEAGNYNKIISDFDKIVDAIVNKSITFNCSMDSCQEGTYAYVYPTQPYEIHLCSSFWNANLTGTDSRGGTIVHELSHFNVVAGTDDIVYGQAQCRQLAITNPSEAIANADSHEYIAENEPPL
jgi:peptidyl-Lys metalloendopeptidase